VSSFVWLQPTPLVSNIETTLRSHLLDLGGKFYNSRDKIKRIKMRLGEEHCCKSGSLRGQLSPLDEWQTKINL